MNEEFAKGSNRIAAEVNPNNIAIIKRLQESGKFEIVITTSCPLKFK